MEPERRENDGQPKRVTISCEGDIVANVPQRDLFSKYGWPARDEIVAALRALKSRRAQASEVEAAEAEAAAP